MCCCVSSDQSSFLSLHLHIFDEYFITLSIATNNSAITSTTDIDTVMTTRKSHSSDNVITSTTTESAETKPRRVRFASSELISTGNQQQPVQFSNTDETSQAHDDIAIHPHTRLAADDLSSFNATGGCCFLGAISATNSTATNGRRRQPRSTSFSSISSTLFPSLSSSSTTASSSSLSPNASSNSSVTNASSKRTELKEQQSHLTKINKFLMTSIASPLSSLLNNQKASKTRAVSMSDLLEQHSAELRHLYENAKAELDCAIETQGSIYYKDDRATAENALLLCSDKYLHVMQAFGDTTHAIKFKFRWEQDLHALQSTFQKLPLRTSPAILEEEHEPSTAYHYFHKYN